MRRGGAGWVLVLSGVLGCWLGVATRPSWHTPIETAQVLAGIVAYPHTNPFFIYHVSLWSVLHEGLAACLYLGLSEIALSQILSALAGMISLQALSLLIYAFGGRALVAAGAAFVIFL